jgi:hypothetical protein
MAGFNDYIDRRADLGDLNWMTADQVRTGGAEKPQFKLHSKFCYGCSIRRIVHGLLKNLDPLIRTAAFEEVDRDRELDHEYFEGRKQQRPSRSTEALASPVTGKKRVKRSAAPFKYDETTDKNKKKKRSVGFSEQTNTCPNLWSFPPERRKSAFSDKEIFQLQECMKKGHGNRKKLSPAQRYQATINDMKPRCRSPDRNRSRSRKRKLSPTVCVESDGVGESGVRIKVNGKRRLLTESDVCKKKKKESGIKKREFRKPAPRRPTSKKRKQTETTDDVASVETNPAPGKRRAGKRRRGRTDVPSASAAEVEGNIESSPPLQPVSYDGDGIDSQTPAANTLTDQYVDEFLQKSADMPTFSSAADVEQLPSAKLTFADELDSIFS